MPTTTQPSTLLSSLAHVLDQSFHDEVLDAFVVLSEPPDAPEDVVIASRLLPPGSHPCDELADFTAPPGCWGVAIVVHGRAHLLDQPEAQPERVVTTYLRHRDGRQVSLLRRRDHVSEERGPVVGRLPDLCRRILGGR